MKQPAPAYDITDTTTLEQLFDSVNEISLLKELDHIDPSCRAWIAAVAVLRARHCGPGRSSFL